MIFVTIFITLAYCVLIGAFIIGFDKVQPFKLENSTPKNSFSILVPFRDEANALPSLLDSLAQLDYPTDKYEIIFIDDDSQDDSVQVIQKCFDKLSMTFSIIKNNRKTGSPKKDAINTAIQEAKFDWIITTDADCIAPKNWLKSFDTFIENKQSDFIVAPVTYNKTNSFLDRFQLLDFLSLQGSTIGGFGINKPFLCNGANLCYSKAIFKNVNGFEGNTSIASGDDIFLLEKVLEQHPDKVNYLKTLDALVITKPQPTFKDLMNQRVRWAAKSTGYKNHFSKLVAFTVLAMNVILILLLMLCLLGYFKWLYLLIIFGIKFSFDFVLFLKTTSFFNQKKVLSSVFVSSFIYPFFSMFVIIASFTSSYHWKGRQFKK